MKKFVCGHCGGRIAVTSRHLQKLVVCPECGRKTHPLAQEILAAAKPAEPASKPRKKEPDPERRCENCGRSIGRLEKVQLWENHVVCATCHEQLTPVSILRPDAAPGPFSPAVLTDRTHRGPATRWLPWKKSAPKLLPSPGEQTVAKPAASQPTVSRGKSAVAQVVATRESLPQSASADAMRVTVARVASAASALPPLTMRQKLAVFLCVVSFAGVAFYGALTLLKDLVSVVTIAALGLLVVAAVVFLLKTGWTYVSYGVGRLRTGMKERLKD